MNYTEPGPCQLSPILPLTSFFLQRNLYPSCPTCPKDAHNGPRVSFTRLGETSPPQSQEGFFGCPLGSQGIYSPDQPPTGHREISTEPSALSSCSATPTLWGPPAHNSCCEERRQKPREGGASSGGAGLEEGVERGGKEGNPAATPGAPASLLLPLWNHTPLYMLSVP